MVSMVVAFALVGPALGACTGGDSERLVIYSGRTENLIGPLLHDFSEETGIKIDVRYGDSADLALLIDEEGDRTPADVFISQSPGAVGYLDAAGRLSELPSEVVDLVPEGDAAADAGWVGLSGRVRTLVYNTDLVDPATLPDSVLDLTEPQYAGEVALAPTNGSFQDFVTVLRHELGDDEAQAWLDGMAADDPPTFDNNTAIVEAVGRGEVPMGLVNHYYAFRALDEDPDLPVENHFFPDGDYGSTLLVTAASIIEGTGKGDDAEELIEFLLSDEAQTFFSDETFEYPLAGDATPNEALPPFDDISKTRVDLDELGGGLEATTAHDRREWPQPLTSPCADRPGRWPSSARSSARCSPPRSSTWPGARRPATRRCSTCTPRAPRSCRSATRWGWPQPPRCRPRWWAPAWPGSPHGPTCPCGACGRPSPRCPSCSRRSSGPWR